MSGLALHVCQNQIGSLSDETVGPQQQFVTPSLFAAHLSSRNRHSIAVYMCTPSELQRAHAITIAVDLSK